jgi:capsular polysaccharide export protein
MFSADGHAIPRIAACVGMSFWKRRRISELLSRENQCPRFVRRTPKAVAIARRDGGGIAVWATREPPELASAAAVSNVPVYRVEDGFLRSVGLGANFTPGVSIVIDGDGIYFDPRRPSGLDRILNDTIFEPAMISRARELARLLVRSGITKYNVGGTMPLLDLPPGRRTIFVPGQVENDRSVVLGGAGIARNIELLRRVRAENPDAFILYKPHPDVEAGHRPGLVPTEDLLRLADLVLSKVSVAAILAAVDEVHTLTSLAGFEALLRGKRVVVHGQPFYSGWGLTEDRAPTPHRTRRLTLEELVAGALILYPRYLDPVTRLPCGPELVIERLSRCEHWRPGPLAHLRRLQGAVARKLRAGSALTGRPTLGPLKAESPGRVEAPR